MEDKIKIFLDLVRKRNGNEPEFMQAVEEVAETVIPYIVNKDIYRGKNILYKVAAAKLKIFLNSFNPLVFDANWYLDAITISFLLEIIFSAI